MSNPTSHSDPFHQETGLDIDDLILFWHIIQQGHFGRAGRVLGFSQPKVSRKVWKLEKYFGTTLMLRGTKGVVLTSTGKEVLEMARGIVEKVHAMRARSNDHKNEMRGEISVICTPGFAHFWLFKVLQSFGSQHQEVQFITSTNDLGNGDLMLGEADIVISSFAPKDLDGTKSCLLCSYPLHLYASKDYLASKGTPRNLDDLQKHDVIILDAPTSSYTHPMIRHMLLTGAKPPKFSASNDSSLIAAVSSGAGISMLPHFVGEGLPSLERVDLTDKTDEIFHEKYISWNEFTCSTERHRSLLSFIKEKSEAENHFRNTWSDPEKTTQARMA